VPSYELSIYDRAECWTSADLDHLRSHARKVRSLLLVGHVFDDEVLAKLPDLSRMELLELEASSISGSGLSQLPRFPKLRFLRIGLERTELFRIPKLSSKLTALELLDIEDPPSRPWGFQDLANRAPGPKSLSIKSQAELFVDGDCPRKIESLSIQATRITAGLKLPKRIDSVYAHLSEMNDRDVDAWLGSVKRIRGLDLRGTPITDAFAETLPARFGLTYLNVVGTDVSEQAVKRIGRAHPARSHVKRPLLTAGLVVRIAASSARKCHRPTTTAKRSRCCRTTATRPSCAS